MPKTMMRKRKKSMEIVMCPKPKTNYNPNGLKDDKSVPREAGVCTEWGRRSKILPKKMPKTDIAPTEISTISDTRRESLKGNSLVKSYAFYRSPVGSMDAHFTDTRQRKEISTTPGTIK